MDDKLKVTGVLSQGYGVIPKLLMRDKEISIEAKGIYAYISSYAGNGSTAFPSISLICSDLGISEKRFYSHKKILEERGYIQVEQERGPNGTFNRNVYTINSVLIPKELPYVVEPSSQNDMTDKEQPSSQKPHSDERHSDKPCTDGVGTNNNSLNNNSLNNNSMTNNNNNKDSKEPVVVVPEINNFQVYQENFGIPSSLILQEIVAWEKDLGKEMVFEAMKRATLNQKPFSWAVGVMRGWIKKNIKTVEQAAADDVAFTNNQKRKYNNFHSSSSKVETLPEWANKPEPTEEVMLDADKQKKFQERLKRYREGGRVVND